MYVKKLHIRNFRGFSDLTVMASGHVVVMGEPGAGRSDLIEALGRVLDANSSRARITTELDFHLGDTSQPIEIMLTLGNLGASVTQDFLDHLELWNTAEDQLVEEIDTSEETDGLSYEWVLRLGYRAKWLSAEERSDEWVFYPKDSDPAADSFVHARRRDIESLGFGLLRWSGARILDLGARSSFRKVVNNASGDDFAAAVAKYVDAVGQAAAQFVGSAQVKSALEDVITPLRQLLDISAADVSNLFQFAPEGGSSSGLLRSLGPSIDLGDGAGSIPAWRHGSTTASLFRVAEALASMAGTEAVLAIDDLGDGIDAAAAAHLAAAIRDSAGQLWVTTRLPAVAEVFEPREVLRMGKDANGARFAIAGKQPATKAESVVFKHWHRNLLPALSYRSVIVVEGPNDFAALHSLALRMFDEEGQPLPATRRVAIVNAGAGGGGGYANVLKLAKEAKEIGLRAVGAIDGDTGSEVQQFVQANYEMASIVVRLPDGNAIEAAIIDGIPDEVLRETISDIAVAAGLPGPQNLAGLSGAPLGKEAIQFIKSNSLHGQFIDTLPQGNLPTLGRLYLKKLIQAATGTDAGLVQL